MDTRRLGIQFHRPDGSWVSVGALHQRGDAIWFASESAYWDLPQRPVLGQVFEELGRRYEPRSRVSLPRWFSHLLPEGYMRRAVSRAANVAATKEFDLLERLGAADLPGAIRAMPLDDAGEVIAPARDEDMFDPEDPILKFSVAGVQLKFSAHHDGRGLTVPARGTAGNCLVKFPDLRPGFDAVPESEHACLRLAAAIGCDTAATFLVDPHDVDGLERWAARGSGNALAVLRFDRPDGGRRHVEELAQILDVKTGDAKYHARFETIARAVGVLAGPDAVLEVIDRIVLNVLVGNGDAHLKNWAVTYPDGHTPRLSPLYDVVPTVLYITGDTLGPSLDGTKAFDEVSLASFARLGERSGIGASRAMERAAAAALRVNEHWIVLTDLLDDLSADRLTRRRRALPLHLDALGP